jgi:AraC family transcriptional regulator of adaptative response/methylated-DNA-[protein]-cysteine methyltransferase
MTNYERIERVIRHLGRNHREQPSLASLARIAGVSEFHFHRMFSRWAGTTPKSFLKLLTAEHAKQLLRESRDVLDVTLETGLSSPSRVHDLLVSVEGMSPGEFKAWGAGITIRYGFHETPFGLCLVGVTSRGICHLAFVNAGEKSRAEAELRAKWPNAKLQKSAKASAKAVSEIFGRGRRKPVHVLLAGTPFQLKVWEALLRIPPGHALSYGDIAATIGKPSASRAVGTAVGSNAIAFLIPCHRVIRETGVIGDYRWGTERKKAILAWESATEEADDVRKS